MFEKTENITKKDGFGQFFRTLSLQNSKRNEINKIGRSSNANSLSEKTRAKADQLTRSKSGQPTCPTSTRPSSTSSHSRRAASPSNSFRTFSTG